jgi:protein TonB
MSFQALLYCQDEKTTRVVTQVLRELDFQVEPCGEHFAAVKRLTGQHFDAVVVDCQNEQNAALMLKSARNSASNQASLIVALVEGQAGVANAFRIGANLVLTKPIAVEQAKGTLRVARGLLKKGGEAAMASAPQPLPAPPKISAVAPPAPPPPAGPPAFAMPTPSFAAPSMVAPSRVSASTPALESDASREDGPAPDAAEAALLESMSGAASTTSMTEDAIEPMAAPVPDPKKEFAWQPPKKQAEPMATALRQAAETAGIGGTAAPATKKPAVKPAASFGAAAAPAPAPSKPQTPAVAEPLSAELPEKVKPAAKSAPPAPRSGQLAELPAPKIGEIIEPAAESSSRKLLLVAVLLIVVGGLAYAGYTYWFQAPHSATPVAAPPTRTAAPPAASVAPAPSSATFSAPANNDITLSTAPEKPSVDATRSATAHVAREQLSPKPGAIFSEPPISKPAAPTAAPIVVKAETHGSTPLSATAPMVEAPQPSALLVTKQPDAAISTIVTSHAALPAKSETVRISQGVTQGLVIQKVQPVYPVQARQMHIQGTVVVQATITKEGTTRDLKVISGPPVLGRAAVDAVRQWRYKPYFLNGEPIEILTQVSVNFTAPN